MEELEDAGTASVLAHEVETAEEARDRMTPEELAADLAYAQALALRQGDDHYLKDREPQ
jgi:hypothetical protein